ncbi:plasma protease C1 inhibitor [Amia ocellicauda]|uniref:plasma protease C1 inhibitor n=1 Tax=Amia ocellicauda TaxID=2972642 RepID=UPI0034640981
MGSSSCLCLCAILLFTKGSAMHFNETEGESIRFNCDFPHSNRTFYWTFTPRSHSSSSSSSSHDLFPSRRHVFYNNMTILTIKELREGDEGRYDCEVKSESDGKWMSKIVVFHIVPRDFAVVQWKDPVKAPAGGSVTLRCSVSHTLDPGDGQILWYRDTGYGTHRLEPEERGTEGGEMEGGKKDVVHVVERNIKLSTAPLVKEGVMEELNKEDRKWLEMTYTQKDPGSDGQRESVRGRVFWASKTRQEGDWSITIDQLIPSDSGIYYCMKRTEGVQEIPPTGVNLTVMDASSFCPPPTYSPLPTPPLTSPPPPTPFLLPHCRAKPLFPWPQCEGGPSRSGEAILGESLTEFAVKLYNFASTSQPSENLLLSPISIAGVLTHLLLGARGHTLSVLEKALSLPPSFNCVHEEMKKLGTSLGVSLETASAVYHNPELKLQDFFVNQSLQFYGAVPQPLTIGNEANRKLINDWVSEKTHGRITKLLDYVSPKTALILLNTVYYKGRWQQQFLESETEEGMFKTLGGRMVKVQVMRSDTYNLAVQYSTQLRAQVARFPLSDGVSAFFLLPVSSTPQALKDVEVKLGEKDGWRVLWKLAADMAKMPLLPSSVSLPRLSLEDQPDLLLMLESLGLEDLFNIPNLCAVSSSYPLSLSDAQHHAMLSFSEEGVEGGATSSLSFARSLPHFSALHPFILVLWSEGAGAPMFIGRVADPSQGQDRGSVV